MLEFIPRKQPEIKNPYSFEEQFRSDKSKFRVEVGNGYVEGVRLCPKQVIAKEPLVLGPGLSENPFILEALAKGAFDIGRIVYTFKHPRRDFNVQANGHPQEQEQKIQTTAAVINKARKTDNPTGNVDAVLRSDSSVNGVFAGGACFKRGDNIIIVDGKLTGPQNEWLMVGRFAAHAAKYGIDFSFHPIDNKHLLKGVGGGVGYMFPPNRVSKAWNEIVAVSKSDIRPILPKLRDRGIGVFAVQGADDHFFPLKDVQRDVAIAGGIQKDPEILAKMKLTVSKRDEKRKVLYEQDSPQRLNKSQTLFDGFMVVKNADHGSIYKNEDYIDALKWMMYLSRKRSYAKESNDPKRSESSRIQSKKNLVKLETFWKTYWETHKQTKIESKTEKKI